MSQTSQTNPTDPRDIAHGILIAGTMLSLAWSTTQYVSLLLFNESDKEGEEKGKSMVRSLIFTGTLGLITINCKK